MKKTIFSLMIAVLSAVTNSLHAQNVDIDDVGSTLDVDWTDSSIVVNGSMAANNLSFFFAEAITENSDTLRSDSVLFIGSLVTNQWTITGFDEHESGMVKICGIDTTTGNRVCTYEIPFQTAWKHILPNNLAVSVNTRTFTSVTLNVSGNFGANANVYLSYKRNGGATQYTPNVSATGYATTVIVTISGLQPGDQLTQVKPYAVDNVYGLASGAPTTTSTLSPSVPDVNGLVSTSVGQNAITTQVNATINDASATLQFARRVTGSGLPLTIMSQPTLTANQSGVQYSHTGLSASTSYDLWAIIINSAGTDSSMITRVTTGLPDDVVSVAISNQAYYSFDATATMVTQNATSLLSLYQNESGTAIDSIVGITVALGTSSHLQAFSGLPGHTYTVTGKLTRQSDGAVVSTTTPSFTLPSFGGMTNTITNVTSPDYFSVTFTNNVGTGYGTGVVYQMITDSVTGVMYDSIAQPISLNGTITRTVSVFPPNRTVKITSLLVRDADSLELSTVKYKKLTVMPDPTIEITSQLVTGNDVVICFEWETVDVAGAEVSFTLGNTTHSFDVLSGTGDTCFSVNDLAWSTNNTLVVSISDTVDSVVLMDDIIIGTAPTNPQINVGNPDTSGLAYGWARIPVTVVTIGALSGEIRILKGLNSNSINTPFDSLTVTSAGTYELMMNYSMYSPDTYVYFTAEMTNSDGGYVLYESYNWIVVPAEEEPLQPPVFMPGSATVTGASTAIISFHCTGNGNSDLWGYFTVYPPNDPLFETDTIWIGMNQNGSLDVQLLNLDPGMYGFKLHAGMGDNELYTGDMDYFTITDPSSIVELIQTSPNKVVQIFNLGGQLVTERKYSELLSSGIVSVPGIYVIVDPTVLDSKGKKVILK